MEKKQARVLTDPELESLFEFISTTKSPARNRTIIMIMHLAGLSVGEVARLTIGDILDQAGTVVEEIKISNRSIPTSDRLKSELQFYCQTIDISDYQAPLFSTQRSSGFTDSTLTQVVNGIYKNAGLVGASTHSGRRGFLINLANKGVSDKVLQELVGHKNVGSTRCYVKNNTSDTTLRNAVNLLK